MTAGTTVFNKKNAKTEVVAGIPMYQREVRGVKKKNGGYAYFAPSLPRIDCGYFGIFRWECESRGCMYSPGFGVDWCFFPNTNTNPETCPFRRVECGHYGIDQDECESRGCCWYPLEEGSSEPWCFHSIESETTPVTETPPEEPMEERPSVSMPEEITRMIYPEEEGEGLAVRRPSEESPVEVVEESTEEAPEAVASTAAPVAENKGTVQNEKLQDETSQAMELTFDWDWTEKPTSKPSQNCRNCFRNLKCDTDALTEHECMAIAECYWEPETTNGFGVCLKRMADSGHRSMGKFFKPKTIY